MRNETLSACIAFVFALGVPVVAGQEPTLRELVAQAQSDITVTHNVDRPQFAFDDVLRATEYIVLARIDQVVGRLSDDEHDIVTSYHLTNPLVVFSVAVGPASGSVFILELRGGKVAIDGFTLTSLWNDVPSLTVGAPVIFLARKDGAVYRLVGPGSIFGVHDAQIVPLDRLSGEHHGYAGMSAETFVNDIVARRRQMQTR